MSVGRASSKLRKVAWKLIVLPCGFSSSSATGLANSTAAATAATVTTSTSAVNSHNALEIMEAGDSPATISSKNLCTICLEPLLNNNGSTSPGHAVFTAQCSHAFHLSCISSNIRHGSMTCPICRAHWTHLPRSLHPPTWHPHNLNDPIIRILDHSITNFRVHRRSFLRSTLYDDDDPIDPNQAQSISQPRISFSLISFSYLSIKVAPKQAIDLVLVATPNGSHLRLLKQSMALAVFALRSIDRLAIVSYSSSAARIFPLRRMTAYGKRAALQVIGRLFYAGHADPIEGIKKGIKILKDRVHFNPCCSILHLSDNLTRIRGPFYMEMSIPIHGFHVSSAGSILHEVEGFLDELIGGGIREIQLRIGNGEDVKIVRLGEVRCDEERRIVLDMGEGECCSRICVGYSYVEFGMERDECVRTGEVVVEACDTRQICEHDMGVNAETGNGGRMSCVESWDYHDPNMARRWAKRLHGMQRS